MSYDAIVIGASAGGIQAIHELLSQLPDSFKLPIIIVQHIKSDSSAFFIHGFDKKCNQPVIEAIDKAEIECSKVYVAPPGYHLLINDDKTFSLSFDELVNYSRPSIDVLFESAADAYGKKLIGIVLTGANSDGAAGLKKIKERGGLLIVQDPEEADCPTMPLAAIKMNALDHSLTLSQISKFLNKL
jgi:two-component system, chemotaxis family, protein-glutamate methylesterase/glutaminase